MVDILSEGARLLRPRLAEVSPEEQEQGQGEEQQPEKLFVGGNRVEDENEYPSLASLVGFDPDDDSAETLTTLPTEWGGCGATLISSRHLVTAGHCVDDNIQQRFDLRGIRIGDLCRVGDKCSESSQFREAAWDRVDVHPRYGPNGKGMPEYDCAIITLPEDVPNHHQYAYVHTGSILDNLGDLPSLTVLGHGRTRGKSSFRPSTSHVLLEAELFRLDDSCCASEYGEAYDDGDSSSSNGRRGAEDPAAAAGGGFHDVRHGRRRLHVRRRFGRAVPVD